MPTRPRRGRNWTGGSARSPNAVTHRGGDAQGCCRARRSDQIACGSPQEPAVDHRQAGSSNNMNRLEMFDPRSLLQQLETFARTAPSILRRSGLTAELADEVARVWAAMEPPFRLAVVGRMRTGKSTLINSRCWARIWRLRTSMRQRPQSIGSSTGRRIRLENSMSFGRTGCPEMMKNMISISGTLGRAIRNWPSERGISNSSAQRNS